MSTRAAAIVLTLLSISACDSSEGAFDLAEVAGTYDGVYTYTGGDEPETEPITLVLAPGPSQTVSLTVRSPYDGDFVYAGAWDETGIRFSRPADWEGPFEFVVGSDGDISGGGSSTLGGVPVALDIDGRLTPEQFDLTMAFEAASGDGVLATTAEYRTSR